ncbi:MAG TPA: hypothetical protein VGD73_05600 [Pseudonocardia sp.]|uniref:hypothetical protein n=1 Tax=Pseudonocardia sp. TaxID=60912 RepID=UPI002EDA765F
MSRLRAPRIAGVAGGVGTTTLATALRGYDRGRAAEQGAEVLVCRSTGGSLHAAATVIAWLGTTGQPRPVLAVIADQPTPIRGPLRARLRMIEPQVNGLVVVPYVPHWRELTDPLAEAARLSDCPADQLPKALRGYGEALARLAEAVLRSGLLAARRPGGPHTPPPANRTTGPVGRTIPTRPVPARPAAQPSTGPPARVTGTGPQLPVMTTGPHAALLDTGPRAAVGLGPPEPSADLSYTPAVAHGGTR